MSDPIQQRIAGLELWLSEQPVNTREEQAHLQEGSRERVYWHAGYLSALKDLLEFMGARETRQ
jgi:hypothetical protein